MIAIDTYWYYIYTYIYTYIYIYILVVKYYHQNINGQGTLMAEFFGEQKPSDALWNDPAVIETSTCYIRSVVIF